MPRRRSTPVRGPVHPRVRGAVAVAGLLAAALAVTACSAPLEPRSHQAAPPPGSSVGATATPSPASDETAPTPGPTGRTSPPSPTSPAAPTSAAPSTAPAAPQRQTVPEASNVPTPRLAPRGRPVGQLPGGDVSWPQCPRGLGIPQKQGSGAPMPLPEARFVVLGLTNGPGFFENPCLASQLAWVRSRHLLVAAYSVISTPQPGDLERRGGLGPFDASTPLGRSANVGYQQARFNLQTMRRAGLSSPVVWLDVEPVPQFDWPADTAANAAVVRGAARGYTDAGLRIGVYSTRAMWQGVVGGLRLGVPEWRAAGTAGRAEAVRRCAADWSTQGGPGVLTQWVEDGRDLDLTCPSAITTTTELARWFHRT